MINDNKDNLKDNQEQEIENQIEESTVEENSENTTTNDVVVDDDKEESTSTKKASKKNDMINYLDKSIINIKQYEYDELDNIVESESNDNSEIYESGLDKKEKDVVQGTIVRVTDRDVFVDIGFKSEGIISKSEFHSTVPYLTLSSNIYLLFLLC